MLPFEHLQHCLPYLPKLLFLILVAFRHIQVVTKCRLVYSVVAKCLSNLIYKVDKQLEPLITPALGVVIDHVLLFK
ncbi:MAG: hypothetical protein JWQ49_3028 [Edaphobacter sp.]|nr:hypothetical protein [Edaphobacter sp.]